MKIRISILYMVAFIAATVGLGITSVIMGDIFKSQTVFTLLFFSGTMHVITMAIMEMREGKVSFDPILAPQPIAPIAQPIVPEVPVPSVPVQPVQAAPEKDPYDWVSDFILKGIDTGSNLNTIIKGLENSGFTMEYIQRVIHRMHDEGKIKIVEKEQPNPVEQKEEQVKKLVEEPKEETPSKPKKEKKKCPKCGKAFKSEKIMRKHYGMAHSADIDL